MYKNKHLVILLMFVCLYGCNSKDSKIEKSKVIDRELFDEKFANDFLSIFKYKIKWHYYPKNSVDEGMNSALSYYLYGLHEDVLCNKKNTVIIRFLWLRSFNKPMVIRLEKNLNNFLLTAKTTNGAGGYGCGLLDFIMCKTVADSTFYNYVNLLNKSGFWKMKTEDDISKTMSDGAMWLLEVNYMGKYHYVLRPSPGYFLKRKYKVEGLQEFSDCCMYLLDLVEVESIKEPLY